MSWRERALCAQVSGDLWFPDSGDLARQARAICHVCPVKAQCLTACIEGDEVHGIWAGRPARQIRAMTKRDAA